MSAKAIRGFVTTSTVFPLVVYGSVGLLLGCVSESYLKLGALGLLAMVVLVGIPLAIALSSWLSILVVHIVDDMTNGKFIDVIPPKRSKGMDVRDIPPFGRG